MGRLSHDRLRALVMNGTLDDEVYAAAQFQPRDLVAEAFQFALAQGYSRPSARELTVAALSGVLPESLVRNSLPI